MGPYILVPRSNKRGDSRSPSLQDFDVRGFQQSGALSGSPYNKDHSILGCILGPFDFWNLPFASLSTCLAGRTL